MSWLIYALGGGWGHLMRSLALGRIAAQTRPVAILTNSPYVAYLSNSPPPLIANCYIQAIPSQATFRETCDRVRQVVLVCAAGRAEELSFYGQLTRDLANSLTNVTVRCLSAECPENCPPELWVFHWPGIDCLPAADVVVGGAGYNTFYECVSVGVPLVAFAFKRQYDRQQMRVSRWCQQQKLPPVRLVKSAEEAKIAIADFLQLPRRNPPSFVNGAIAAVQIIEYATASRLLRHNGT